MANLQVRRQRRYGPSRSTNTVRAVRIDGGRYEPQLPRRLTRLLLRVAIAALAVTAIGLWGWSLSAERRAIYHLPSDERAVVYFDAMKAFEATCAPPRAGLNEYCRSQATFLANFPDCDERCRQVTAPMLHWRHR